MDENLKTQYFNEIIAIRSGLSSIFENQNKINAFLGEIEKVDQSIAVKENEKDKKINEKDKYKTSYDKEEADVKKVTYELEKTKIELNNAVKAEKSFTGKKVFHFEFLLISLLLLGLIAFCVYNIIATFEGDPIINLGPYFLALGIPICIGALIGSICCIGDLYTYRHSDFAKMRKNSERVLNLKEKKSKLESDARFITFKLHEAVMKEYDESVKNIENDLLLLNDTKVNVSKNLPEIKELEEKNSVIYESLKANHSSIFCERDWAYLDLIIFYMDTGRADSLKEALLLVDQQVQTDQITSAINSMKNQLSNIVTQGIKFLGETINNNFMILSTQINGLKVNISKSLKNIIDQNELSNKFYSNLSVSTQEMSAQLSKIQDSTKKISDLESELIKIEAKKLNSK